MAIIAKKICKQFGEPPTKVLYDIDLEVQDGEFVSLTGKSGSGKSTLLYIISTLDTASSGYLTIGGEDVLTMSEQAIHRFRNQHMGFVFQFHHLLPELTALENVLMPARKNMQEKTIEPYAIKLMEEFGLSDKLQRFPSQLSGGEQQRVAIARALVMKPKYLFADEPTGNLDSTNGNIVMSLFKKINNEMGTTVVFVTHDTDFAKLATRSVHLIDGRVSNIK